MATFILNFIFSLYFADGPGIQCRLSQIGRAGCGDMDDQSFRLPEMPAEARGIIDRTLDLWKGSVGGKSCEGAAERGQDVFGRNRR
jgi:hypothetical protein